jgi:hypothetical protein
MQACAVAHAIERLLATPKTAPNLFSRSIGEKTSRKVC